MFVRASIGQYAFDNAGDRGVARLSGRSSSLRELSGQSRVKKSVYSRRI